MPVFVFDTVRHNATASIDLKRSQNKSVKLFFRLYTVVSALTGHFTNPRSPLPHPANFECDRRRVHSAAADVRNGRERRAAQLLPHRTANFRLPVGNLTLPTLQANCNPALRVVPNTLSWCPIRCRPRSTVEHVCDFRRGLARAPQIPGRRKASPCELAICATCRLRPVEPSRE